MSGAERIAAERRRQIEEEGWTAEHDAQHRGDLVRAAAAYLLENPKRWPWTPDTFRVGYSLDGRIRGLEKAGALIAAEIDRLLASRG